MRWFSLLRPLAILTACLAATAAFAVAPVFTDPAHSAVRSEIETELGPSHSYALVLGISDFDNPGWPHLTGVKPEIEAVTDALIKQHFQIVPESHVGRIDHATLAADMAKFFATYGQHAEDRLVIYVATHGYADPRNDKGDGYLVASDAGAPADSAVPNGYSVQELSAALAGVEAQHIFMFFDSCFSGAMLPEPTRAFDSILADKPPEALSPETAKWTLRLLSQNARLILTAGSSTETVFDRDSPFASAVVDALGGAADADGDGLTLGTEIAQYVRGRVARASILAGHPNDPVFAVLPKVVAPSHPRPDAPDPDKINYGLQGDFVFLTPGGPKTTDTYGRSEQEALLRDKTARLEHGQFLACVDCPTMVDLPGNSALALASTEITYAQWDACYREMACRRYLSDDGFGRGDRPVANVTWQDALEYITWLKTKAGPDAPCTDYRLPTAKEWMDSALYSTAGPVTWAEAVADAQPVCWGCGAGDDGTAAIRSASQPADAAGLYDMVGNLWEWTGDNFDAGDNSVCDMTAIRQNGQCTPGKVMGGSFATSASALPHIAAGGSAPRTSYAQPWSSPTIGFRVACDVTRSVG